MKKVVITGVTGFRNRGVEAMVRVTIDQLLQINPEIQIKVITDTPSYDQMRTFNNSVQFLPRLAPTLIGRAVNRASKYYKPLSFLYPVFQGASLLIATGGDVFSSDYPKALDTFMPPLEAALHAKVPITFLAQSIIFKTEQAAQQWLKVGRHSKLITVREKISYDYLTEKLGLSSDLVIQTADPAFLLDPIEKNISQRLLKSYGLDFNRPIVAIAPSVSIASYHQLDKNKHLKRWLDLTKFLIDDLKFQVLIVPHVQNNGEGSDDRIIATKILKDLNYNPEVHIAGADHTASEFKGLISCCNILVAERMHAAIAGLSTHIPTLVIGYSIKARGIMTDILGKELVDQGLVISIQDFLENQDQYKVVQYICENKESISQLLKERISIIKKLAQKNYELISDILK